MTGTLHWVIAWIFVNALVKRHCVPCNKRHHFLNKRYSTYDWKILSAMALHWNKTCCPIFYWETDSQRLRDATQHNAVLTFILSSSKGLRGKNCVKILHILLTPSSVLTHFDSQYTTKRMTLSPKATSFVRVRKEEKQKWQLLDMNVRSSEAFSFLSYPREGVKMETKGWSVPRSVTGENMGGGDSCFTDPKEKFSGGRL